MHPAELAVHAGQSAPPIVAHDCAGACAESWMRLKGVAARRGEVQRPRTLEAARRVMSDVARGCLLRRLAAECLRWSRGEAAP